MFRKNEYNVKVNVTIGIVIRKILTTAYELNVLKIYRNSVE